ncbi:uncharacterized protein [Diadema setosum]|uniref:uncharacterized protein n=1 Tax=Diadema setosum TaxID=31175 RepID=UPI003B3B6719
MALVFKLAHNANTATSLSAVMGIFHRTILTKCVIIDRLRFSPCLCGLACTRSLGQECREQPPVVSTKPSFTSFDSAEIIKQQKFISRAQAVSVTFMPSLSRAGMKSLYGIQTNLGQYSHSLSTRAVLVQPCQLRHYSMKKSKSKTSFKSKNKARNLEDQDSSDESSSEDEEEEEEEEEDWKPDDDDEVDEAKRDWKDLKMSVPSLRIDAILSAGLGISRKKVEDAFLSAKLRHNGQKVTKKSKQVVEGDILDVVRDEKVAPKDDDQRVVVMRVAVMRVKDERSASDRIPVRLRRWKRLELPHKK